MSDLQCPATIILVPPAETAEMAERLRRRGIARVHASPDAGQPGRQLADALGVGLARFDGDVDGLADMHRGETVVVLDNGRPGTVELTIDNDGRRQVPWPPDASAERAG